MTLYLLLFDEMSPPPSSGVFASMMGMPLRFHTTVGTGRPKPNELNEERIQRMRRKVYLYIVTKCTIIGHRFGILSSYICD